MTFDIGSHILELLSGRMNAAAKSRDRKDAFGAIADEQWRIFRRWPGIPLALADLDERELGGKKPAFEVWLKAWQRSLDAVPDYTQLPPLPAVDLKLLPAYSFFLQFRFTLERPLATGDDSSLPPTENMFRTERATGLPVFAASSWKGCFGAALREAAGPHELEDLSHVLMGGVPGDNEHEEAQRGRLVFFSSYFSRLDTHTFHPLNRATKTGTPITVQVVPENTSSCFSLLYVPKTFGSSSGRMAQDEVAQYAPMIGKTLYLLFRMSGFGAKSSSGFGLAYCWIDGKLSISNEEYPVSCLKELQHGLPGCARGL